MTTKKRGSKQIRQGDVLIHRRSAPIGAAVEIPRDGGRVILAVHPQLCPIPPQPRSGEAPLPLGKPQKLTCHNAVASTFYLRGEQYAPQVET